MDHFADLCGGVGLALGSMSLTLVRIGPRDRFPCGLMWLIGSEYRWFEGGAMQVSHNVEQAVC